MSAHNTKWTGNFHQLLFWRRMYCLRNHPVDPKYGFGFDYTQKKEKKEKAKSVQMLFKICRMPAKTSPPVDS